MTASEQTRTSPTNGAVEPTGDGHQCIFDDLTARFVVYRAHRASTRGMSFSWQTTGGFTPLTMTLGTQAPLPTSLSYLPGARLPSGDRQRNGRAVAVRWV
jgi:hypothetical protein